MGGVFRLTVGILFPFVSFVSSAAIPLPEPTYCSGSTCAIRGVGYAAWCEARRAYIESITGVSASATLSPPYCYITRNGGYDSLQTPDFSIPGACPANSTQFGDTCTCNAGYSEDASHTACIKPEPPVTQPDPNTPSEAGSCTRRPILPATGEKLYTENDYTGTGPQALQLVRSFRSRWSVAGGHRLAATAGSANPGLGLAWAHNHNATLAVSPNTSATLLQGSGSTLSFTWTAGVWRPSDNGTSTLVANTLPSTGQPGYLLTRADDDSRWQFDGAGRLLAITDRNGWTTSYTYSGNQLSTVTNAFGRSIRFAYNAAGQLSTATLPDGQTISYTFDSAQRLSAVGYPGNVSKTYLYEDARWPQSVTGIVDENGNRLASVVYDAQGRAVESGYAGGADYYKVAYPATSNWSSAQITDPLGTVRTYSYGTALGKLNVTGADKPSGSGGADAASRVQNASGLIDYETDFLGVQTTYSWDTIRRLPTATTRAAGRAEAQTTTTQWHPVWRLPTLVTEGTRSTALGYDTLGHLTSQTTTDTATGQQRSWGWTYNSQGLVATSTDPLGASTSFSYDSAGNLTALKDPLGQQSTFTYDTAGRVLTQTAPNGLLTSYAYDLRGRLVQTTQGSGTAAEVQSYSYTPSGQLASTTLPSGYAITYRYDSAQRLIGASDNRGNSVA